MQFDGLALVYVQVGEPHGGGEQDQQQQELELLPDLLHGEAQHPGSLILRWMVRMGGKEVISAALWGILLPAGDRRTGAVAVVDYTELEGRLIPAGDSGAASSHLDPNSSSLHLGGKSEGLKQLSPLGFPGVGRETAAKEKPLSSATSVTGGGGAKQQSGDNLLKSPGAQGSADTATLIIVAATQGSSPVTQVYAKTRKATKKEAFSFHPRRRSLRAATFLRVSRTFLFLDK